MTSSGVFACAPTHRRTGADASAASRVSTSDVACGLRATQQRTETSASPASRASTPAGTCALSAALSRTRGSAEPAINATRRSLPSLAPGEANVATGGAAIAATIFSRVPGAQKLTHDTAQVAFALTS